MKLYCPVCDCKQEIEIIEKEETYSVKGEPITIMASVCTCVTCHEEILSLEYDDNNICKAYAIYRSRHNLLQPEEIKAIREQYNITQVTFARILGVGDKTIARYENGSLQDEAINNLIFLAKDPKNFAALLEKNQNSISCEERERLKWLCGHVTFYAEWRNKPSIFSYGNYSQAVQMTSCA